MATVQRNGTIRHLRRAALLRDGGGMTDGQLLGCFLASHEEAAFEALVRRHGPMVLGVCRRLLHDEHDAEDAFQATFLVLVRRATAIAPRELVGHWLYGVAYRTALRARAATARRRAKERQVKDMPTPQAGPADVWHDLRPLLDRELNRLPERYRMPLVLCYLQGQSKREVARRLDLPEGTVSTQLARGREMLRQRLTRRGLALTTAALAAALSASMASASVPAPLVGSTVQAATLVAAGTATAGAISAKVVALTEGVLKAMFLTKLKIATALLLAVGLVVTGAAVLTQQAQAEKPAQPAAKEQGTPAPKKEVVPPEKKDAGKPEKQPDLTGQITAVSSDFLTITLAIPPKIKGDAPTTVEIKLSDKTKVTYFGVEPNGENLTVGYVAQVWLVEGSPDRAAGLRLGRKDADAGKGPDLIGQILAVSKDGKTLTLEIPPKEKGQQPTRTEIKLTDKTKFSYFGVDQGGETPTAGYVILVWLAEGSKDTAAGVRLGLKN